MKHLKRLAVAGALVITALGMAGSAQATQLTPTGAERTFSSSNLLLSVHNGGTVRCTSSTFTQTIAGTSASTVAVSTTALTYGSCTANGALPATIDVNCPALLFLETSVGLNQAVVTTTLPTGCTITATVPPIGCTLTIKGDQIIGNNTAGFGGGVLTGGATPTIHLNNSIVRDISVDGPTTTACATNANHTATGTLTATFTGNGTLDVD